MIRPQLNKKRSINAKRVAEKVIETVRIGEAVSLAKIMKEVGYSDSVANQPSRVTSQQVYKETVNSYIDKMKALRDKVIIALDRKDYDKATMFDMNNLLKTLNHDVQLLEGKSTENVAVKTQAIVYGSDDFLALQMSKQG